MFYLEFILHIIIFIFGLILGSFYNVVGLRIPKKESIVYPPSHCTKCGHRLRPWELIPVLSYLFLRGRCKHCHTLISPLYPSIELATASLFTLAPWFLGWSSELFVAWSFLSLLMIILVTDLSYMLIPNKILLFFGVLLVLLRIAIPMSPWWDPLAGGLMGFVLLFLIAVISRGGMGGGDIKLFAVLGIVLGWQGILLTLMLSSMLGALIGGIGLLLGLVKRKQAIPFGPYIAAGAIITYFAGDHLVRWYLQILLF